MVIGANGLLVIHISAPVAILASVGLAGGGNAAHDRQIMARPDQAGSWAIGVWAGKVASQSCLRRNEPDGGHPKQYPATYGDAHQCRRYISVRR